MTTDEAGENIMFELYVERRMGNRCCSVFELGTDFDIPDDIRQDALSLLAREGLTKSMSNVDVTIAMPDGVDWAESYTALSNVRVERQQERDAVLRAIRDAEREGVRRVPLDEVIKRTALEPSIIQFDIDYLAASDLLDTRLGGAVLTTVEGRAYLDRSKT